MIYYGRFTQYVPETFPEGFPELMRESVVWTRNEAGQDLYDLRKTLPAAHSFVITEDDNSIRVVHTDPHAVFPNDGGHLYAIPGEVERDTTVLMGKLFDPETGTLVDRPPRVPSSISDRQFFQALALRGIITEEDALAAVQTGFVPPPVQAIIDTITDPAEKFAAKMLVSGATVYERSNSLVTYFGASLGWTEAQIDEFFVFAASL